MTSLANLSAPPEPRAALRELFGFDAFREGQEEVVSAVLAGEDTLAIMPTGAGKSLCYQLPAMLLPGCTAVVSPLVALMKDQLESLPPALRARAAVFNSMVDRGELDSAAEELHDLALAGVSRLVVDEAHCLSLWGHDFRPDYLFLPSVARELGNPPLLLMTATATPALQAEIGELFGRTPRLVNTGVVRPNLFLQVSRTRNADDTLRLLAGLCRQEGGPGIVYAQSRKQTEEIASKLRVVGVSAIHYHAGMEREERTAAQDAFMAGQQRIVVATVAFGMGIDKPDVRFVVHVHPARSLEAYAQEAGRAGRDGQPANCILFWTNSASRWLAKVSDEDRLSPETMSAVYKVVRASAEGRYAWLPLDYLDAAVRQATNTTDSQETEARVAVAALELAGVLRRHCDLPESARLWLQPGTASGAVPPALAARLAAEPGGRALLPLRALAALLDVPLIEVEVRLLALRDGGAIGYQGMGRGLLIELLSHPPDLRERLKDLIERRRQGRARRTASICAYAEGNDRCRNAVIAEHFGRKHPGRCEHCDICVPGSAWQPDRHAMADERAPEDIILAAIPELPFPLGRKGLAHMLMGSRSSPVQADRCRWFGALGLMSEWAVYAAIGRLLNAGYVEMDDSKYRLLTVTAAGLAKPPALWPPPGGASPATRPPPARRPRERTRSAPPATPDQDAPRIEERFQRLRAWRTETAREKGLPPYAVFADYTLRLLATSDIHTRAGLALISGIGPAKLNRYGDALLELLRDEE